MKENALVTSVYDGSAWVEPVAKAGCSGCSLKQSCGTGLLSSWLGSRRLSTKVVNTLDVVVGDQVVIWVPDRGLLTIAAVTYLLPLLGLFIFTLFAQALGLKDYWFPVAAIAGLLCGFLSAKKAGEFLVNLYRLDIVMLSKSSAQLGKKHCYSHDISVTKID